MIPNNIKSFLKAKPDEILRNFLSKDGHYRWLAIFVGRIVAQKNLFLLLRLAARLCQERSDIRFICIGAGPLLPALQEQTHRLGLSEVVLWLGSRPHQEVVRYIGTCDFMVLPSIYEGFARVLIEAAAAGKPIITTSVSGADDGVVDGKTGYIVPVDDIDMLTEAFRRILANRHAAIKMGQKGRDHIQSVINNYADPYKQIEIWQQVFERGRRNAALIDSLTGC
jgi:glycosyltransferase involved in cell wall biosynthesis